MTGDRRKHVFLVLAFGLTGAWQPASAAEFQCRHGDQLRRVEVNSGEAAPDAACEVRYWRDASTPAEGQVLWRANQDVDFCDSKARDLLARLERGGWTCASAPAGELEPFRQATAPSAPREPAPPAAPPDAAPRQAPEPVEPAPTTSAAAEPAAEGPAPGAAAIVEPSAPMEQPPTTVEPSARIDEPTTTAATGEPSTPVERPAPGALAGVAPSAPIEELAAPPADDPAAGHPPADSSPAGNPNAPLLDRVVGQTLRSVQQMYGGDFRAEDTAFGDLDGDGRDDAAVLVTYQTEREDYVQYLVAYLFDGETFQSTATKNVGGRFLDALRADVRGIVDRAIVVDLQALDAGEVCCETRRAAFVLREGQLVEVKDSAGVPRGRS